MKVLVNLIWLICVIIWMMPWTNEADTRRALNYSGFSDIRTNGHSFFACPSDWSATEFEATNPVGLKRVSGTVCCGLFMKACTIRW